MLIQTAAKHNLLISPDRYIQLIIDSAASLSVSPLKIQCRMLINVRPNASRSIDMNDDRYS